MEWAANIPLPNNWVWAFAVIGLAFTIACGVGIICCGVSAVWKYIVDTYGEK